MTQIVRAHTTIPADQWNEGEHRQKVTWDVFRFRYAGLLMARNVRQTSTRRENMTVDSDTGSVMLTIEADVEERVS